MDFSEVLRPLECPVCDRKHSLWGHGVYWRNVCDLLILPVLIPILRYYCPGCGHTVSFLPSFCVPRKQYSAGVISLCFQLVFACGVSFRQVSKAYPAISRILAGIWVKQWSFSSIETIAILRNHFGFHPEPADICSGHNSNCITPESLEAFFVSCDFVLSDSLTYCHGQCDILNSVECDNRACAGILKGLQEKFSSLPFSVRLF